MGDVVLVNLVHDPFRIFAGDGYRVTLLADEIKAFQAIGEILRHVPDGGTQKPPTYILNSISWQHFRSVRSLKGVRITEFTPRGQMKLVSGLELPDWLTDEAIIALRILERPIPLIKDDWAGILAENLYPGIIEAGCIKEFLFAAANIEVVPEPIAFPQIVEWICDRFQKLASFEIPHSDIVSELTEQLRNTASPSIFSKKLMRRCALLPLIRPGHDQVLSVPGLQGESIQDITLAKYVPLPFPLPEPMNAEVCRLMSRAVRSAQLEKPDTFEQVATALNAIWGGVADELDRWLQVNPRGMTEAAARHLSGLPGFANDETAKRIVELFSPPPPVSRWTGLDESFEQWVSAYAEFIERMFYRRTLPVNGDDPAEPFASWVKANPTVFFNHPDKGYFCVAGQIQKALQSGRPVIIVLVDALAIHVLRTSILAFSSALGDSPTSVKYSFSPVPTITEVCKEAILGGILPDQCTGDLHQTILTRYGLNKEQFQHAAHWQDAERVRVTKGVRLLVYRDNRLDENLSTFTSYRSLRESFVPVINSIAKLVKQWVDEFRHWQNSPPLVLLTGDHGFTFGPKIEFSSGQTNNSNRCVALGKGAPNSSEIRDDSFTFLDRETFHLRGGYLVARGRLAGTKTMSGWALSHGGLLPEEVIVPVIEWHGDQQALPFPDITVPDGVLRDRGNWILTIHLRNINPVQTPGGRIRITPVGHCVGPTTQYPILKAGASAKIYLEVSGDDVLNSPEITFEVTLSPQSPEKAMPDLVRHVNVPKAKQFIERTKDQAAFEEMF